MSFFDFLDSVPSSSGGGSGTANLVGEALEHLPIGDHSDDDEDEDDERKYHGRRSAALGDFLDHAAQHGTERDREAAGHVIGISGVDSRGHIEEYVITLLTDLGGEPCDEVNRAHFAAIADAFAGYLDAAYTDDNPHPLIKVQTAARLPIGIR
jgi:hypothetical protein